MIEQKIRNIILGMGKMFTMEQLFAKTKNAGIKNEDFILDVFGELYESGKIRLRSGHQPVYMIV